MGSFLEEKISVVIPVYNAAPFIEKAVRSALIQREVSEVILIEDGSTDNSLNVCNQLLALSDKVKLLTHPANENKGAGISRNVGIEQAKGEYIAFLDADDYFLPDRFRAERKLFGENEHIDGVFGALGYHYYSKEKQEKASRNSPNTLTIPGQVSPDELFLSLLWMHDKYNGCFSVDTLTVKRNIFFGKTPVFNNLDLHEDTVFLLQLVLNCVIQPGITDEPVGMRGVHDNNRITQSPRESPSWALMWKELYDWSLNNKHNKYLQKFFKSCFVSEKIKYASRTKALQLFFWESISNPYFLTMGECFNASCKIALGQLVASKLLFMKVRIQHLFFKNNSFVKNHRQYLIQKFN